VEKNKPEISDFDSVDPAPPSKEKNVPNLRRILTNENERMFQRMRALFSLRGIGGVHSVEALAAAFDSKSALLKHEVAYVMGQMQDPHAIPFLISRLEDIEEDLMVRHEDAEALGAIGDRTALLVLRKFETDSEPVISESCEVALDLLEWVASKRLDYTD
jgi:deoxyhypusine monooxygenase